MTGQALSENAQTLIWVVLIGIGLFVFFALFEDKKPPVKDDPDEMEQRKLGREMNLGKTTPEEIAEKEHYDVEHVKKWKQDYIDAAVKHSFEIEKESAERDKMAWDNVYLKAILYNKLGPDWEAQTGYANRRMYDVPEEKKPPEKKDDKK